MKKYKQFIFGILVGALLFGGLSVIADNQIQAVLSDIKVTINGTPLQMDNQPISYQDRTYLPVRKIAEAVGKKVDWDETNNTVIIGEVAVAVNKADYISLDEARKLCKGGYDIMIEDYNNKTAYLFLVTWITEGKTTRTSETILSGIPFVYIDRKEYIPLEYFNNNVLPLLN